MLHFIPMQALTYIPSDDVTIQRSARRSSRVAITHHSFIYAIYCEPICRNCADEAQTRSSRSSNPAKAKSTVPCSQSTYLVITISHTPSCPPFSPPPYPHSLVFCLLVRPPPDKGKSRSVQCVGAIVACWCCRSASMQV